MENYAVKICVNLNEHDLIFKQLFTVITKCCLGLGVHIN